MASGHLRTAETDGSQATLAVAFSGGRDSLALLHASCRAAQTLGLQVVALHVHHGLLAEADGWLLSAQRLCARWRRRGWPLRLRWARLSGQPAPGDSLEAWARAGRYEALARLAAEEGASLLLLAQHRRDQAETVLLQALRGGGPAGLSAMPVTAQRGGLSWARPWLDQPRGAIEAYSRRYRLRPIDDPSNDDTTLARNRLRQQVWPALQAAFPDAEVALAAAARRAQEASSALAELAALDLLPLVDADGSLQVAGWRTLSPARQANALRAWFSARAGAGPAHTLVARLLAEVRLVGAARWPMAGGGSLALYRGRLRLAGAGAAPGQPAGQPVTPPPSVLLDLSGCGRWPVPGWPGSFEVSASVGPGVPADRLRQVDLRPRVGGERFQAAPGSLPRSLKKQYQSAGVPEQQRGGPLVWSGDEVLLFVPGLGPDARCCATAGPDRRALRWCPDTPLSALPKPAG